MNAIINLFGTVYHHILAAHQGGDCHNSPPGCRVTHGGFGLTMYPLVRVAVLVVIHGVVRFVLLKILVFHPIYGP